MQNVSFVPEEGGGYVLSPFFSDLTEGKPLFFVKDCFSPSKLFPLFFFFGCSQHSEMDVLCAERYCFPTYRQ